MANKKQVFETHTKHPEWQATDIAEALHTSSAYVRATARRMGFNLPKKHPADPVSMRAEAARLIAKAERIEREAHI